MTARYVSCLGYVCVTADTLLTGGVVDRGNVVLLAEVGTPTSRLVELLGSLPPILWSAGLVADLLNTDAARVSIEMPGAGVVEDRRLVPSGHGRAVALHIGDDVDAVTLGIEVVADTGDVSDTSDIRRDGLMKDDQGLLGVAV